MGATAAFRDGIRRVNGAPALLAGLCLLTLLLALPLSVALRGMIDAQLGDSLAAQRVASSADYQWWQQFLHQAGGLGTTFTPSIIGFGAVLDNLDALLDNEPMAATVTGVTTAWLLLWSFVSGGVIDRLARDRKTRAAGFFAAAGVHFWRFLRLGLFAFVAYWFLFAWVHEWLFGGLYERLIRDMTSERTAMAIRLACYLVFGAALVFVNVAFDYARIRIVVEDRRSAIGAMAAGARFVRRHPGSVAALYLLNSGAFVLLLAAYAILSPGAPASRLLMWGVLLLGQMFIVGRQYLKLVFYASQTALFQSALAHAAYTAPPVVEWPDSPAAEGVTNPPSHFHLRAARFGGHVALRPFDFAQGRPEHVEGRRASARPVAAP